MKDVSAKKNTKAAPAKPEKKKEDDNVCKPKRPLSVYLHFVNDNRARVIKENPNFKITEVMKH